MGRVAVAACALGIAACNVADPIVNGVPIEPQHTGEQAEVATAVAQTLNNQTVWAAAYRFTGPMPLGTSGLDDIVYGSNNTVTFRDGASLMGFSTSLTGGFWSPGAKIFPHLVPNFFGDPTAIIWGDPSIAAGFNNHALVAYADLAVSQGAFDALKGGDGALHCWPGSSSIKCSSEIVDSVCVAISTDGAQSFPSLYCKRPANVGANGTDQTSIGINAADRIFVVTDDVTNDTLDLYELTPNQPPYFVPLAVDAQMQPASHTPRIARDQDGELWLAASRNDLQDVRLCHIVPGTMSGGGSCDFVGDVTHLARAFPKVLVSNVGNVRTGLTVSFAANRVNPTDPMVVAHTDFYFAYHLNYVANKLHIGVTECRLPQFGSFVCQDVPAWGTATATAQQIEPSIAFVDRSMEGDGSQPDVEYAFYETDSPAVAPGHARVRRARLLGSPFGGPPPTLLVDNLNYPDPAVCTAKYDVQYEYWGDFFAFDFVFGLHQVVFSSNEPTSNMSACAAQTNNFQGHPLHLQSWAWPN